MYVLNEEVKKLVKINETKFSEHGLTERYDLQEWIDSDPKILSKELGEDEDLLIIQKEFNRFDKTKERLDLLAIDKNGNLVIIENKLDDSGKDVTWQALKYVSYCSTLTKNEIISIYKEYLDKKYPGEKYNAEQKLSEHLNNEDANINIGYSQRIILVAREFRPEVTSTVLWLRGNRIDIQCIKVVPYLFGNDVIIDIDKIIPVPEIEEFTIRATIKETEEKDIAIAKNISDSVYSQYWSRLLEYGKSNSLELYSNRTGSSDNWIAAASGIIPGVIYSLVLLKDKIRAELYIDRKSVEENKKIFDLLNEERELIENKFGGELNWERLDDRKASRISVSTSFIRDDYDNWNIAIKWHVENIKKLENAMQESLSKIKNKF